MLLEAGLPRSCSWCTLLHGDMLACMALHVNARGLPAFHQPAISLPHGCGCAVLQASDELVLTSDGSAFKAAPTAATTITADASFPLPAQAPSSSLGLTHRSCRPMATSDSTTSSPADSLDSQEWESDASKPAAPAIKDPAALVSHQSLCCLQHHHTCSIAERPSLLCDMRLPSQVPNGPPRVIMQWQCTPTTGCTLHDAK